MHKKHQIGSHHNRGVTYIYFEFDNFELAEAARKPSQQENLLAFLKSSSLTFSQAGLLTVVSAVAGHEAMD